MRSECSVGTGDYNGTSKSSRCRATAPVRRAVVRAVDLSAAPPLHWWRLLPADAYTGAHLDTLHKAISGITFLNEPRWPDAVRGDPATAIGIALRTVKREGTPSPVVDLVMSAVLLTAMAGDPAAVQVLITMIKGKGAKTAKSRIVASWQGGARRNRSSVAAAKGTRRGTRTHTTAGA